MVTPRHAGDVRGRDDAQSCEHCQVWRPRSEESWTPSLNDNEVQKTDRWKILVQRWTRGKFPKRVEPTSGGGAMGIRRMRIGFLIVPTIHRAIRHDRPLHSDRLLWVWPPPKKEKVLTGGDVVSSKQQNATVCPTSSWLVQDTSNFWWALPSVQTRIFPPGRLIFSLPAQSAHSSGPQTCLSLCHEWPDCGLWALLPPSPEELKRAVVATPSGPNGAPAAPARQVWLKCELFFPSGGLSSLPGNWLACSKPTHCAEHEKQKKKFYIEKIGHDERATSRKSSREVHSPARPCPSWCPLTDLRLLSPQAWLLVHHAPRVDAPAPNSTKNISSQVHGMQRRITASRALAGGLRILPELQFPRMLQFLQMYSVSSPRCACQHGKAMQFSTGDLDFSQPGLEEGDGSGGVYLRRSSTSSTSSVARTTPAPAGKPDETGAWLDELPGAHGTGEDYPIVCFAGEATPESNGSETRATQICDSCSPGFHPKMVWPAGKRKLVERVCVAGTGTGTGQSKGTTVAAKNASAVAKNASAVAKGTAAKNASAAEMISTISNSSTGTASTTANSSTDTAGTANSTTGTASTANSDTASTANSSTDTGSTANSDTASTANSDTASTANSSTDTGSTANSSTGTASTANSDTASTAAAGASAPDTATSAPDGGGTHYLLATSPSGDTLHALKLPQPICWAQAEKLAQRFHGRLPIRREIMGFLRSRNLRGKNDNENRGRPRLFGSWSRAKAWWVPVLRAGREYVRRDYVNVGGGRGRKWRGASFVDAFGTLPIIEGCDWVGNQVVEGAVGQQRWKWWGHAKNASGNVSVGGKNGNAGKNASRHAGNASGNVSGGNGASGNISDGNASGDMSRGNGSGNSSANSSVVEEQGVRSSLTSSHAKEDEDSDERFFVEERFVDDDDSTPLFVEEVVSPDSLFFEGKNLVALEDVPDLTADDTGGRFEMSSFLQEMDQHGSSRSTSTPKKRTSGRHELPSRARRPGRRARDGSSYPPRRHRDRDAPTHEHARRHPSSQRTFSTNQFSLVFYVKPNPNTKFRWKVFPKTKIKASALVPELWTNATPQTVRMAMALCEQNPACQSISARLDGRGYDAPVVPAGTGRGSRNPPHTSFLQGQNPNPLPRGEEHGGEEREGEDDRERERTTKTSTTAEEAQDSSDGERKASASDDHLERLIAEAEAQQDFALLSRDERLAGRSASALQNTTAGAPAPPNTTRAAPAPGAPAPPNTTRAAAAPGAPAPPNTTPAAPAPVENTTPAPPNTTRAAAAPDQNTTPAPPTEPARYARYDLTPSNRWKERAEWNASSNATALSAGAEEMLGVEVVKTQADGVGVMTKDAVRDLNVRDLLAEDKDKKYYWRFGFGGRGCGRRVRVWR